MTLYTETMGIMLRVVQDFVNPLYEETTASSITPKPMDHVAPDHGKM